MMAEEEVISISDSESSRQSLVLLQDSAKLSNNMSSNLLMENNQKKDLASTTSSNNSTERCPVTWNNTAVKKKPFKFLNSESFITPSPRTKVSSWLYGHCQNNSIVDSKNSQTYSDNKSAILIRQDYRKPEAKNSPSLSFSAKVLSNSADKSTCSVIYRGNSIISDFVCSNTNSEGAKEDSLVYLNSSNNDEINSNKHIASCDALSINGNELSMDLNVPSKTELCAYLQLMTMNPVDGKIIGSKQNRRSSRVKNLAIMSEKRALERELNSSDQKREKKKTTYCLDQDLKSSTGSESSKESRPSSKVSNRTKLSVSAKKKNPPSKQTANEENTVSNGLHIPANNTKSPITRTKSLQVPEVSTTSTSTTKTVTELVIDVEDKIKKKNKSLDKNLSTSSINSKKSDGSANSERSTVIMTRKSLLQLNININTIKTKSNLKKLQTIKDSLLKYIVDVPKMDFEDSFKKIISDNDIKKHFGTKNKKIILRDVKNQRTKNSVVKKTNLKSKRNVQSVLRNGAKTTTNLNEKVSKSRLRQLHEKLQVKRKLKKKRAKRKPTKLKQNLHSPRRNLLKLRSRGKLKQIGIKSVLLNHEKKKKKRYVVKGTQVTPKRDNDKEFKETTLIQTDAAVLCKPVDEAKPAQTEHLSLKVLKLKSEIDLLKNLTPEHRKALFESKKFLIMRSKDTPKAGGDVEIPKKKTIETVETSEFCDSTSTLPKVTPVDRFSRPSSEDLEVRKLMSSNYLKDTILQQKSKSIEVTSLLRNSLDSVIKEKWTCTSSSKSSYGSNASLQTLGTDLEPIRTPVREDVEGNSENASHESESDVNGICVPDAGELIDEDEEEQQVQPEVVDISNIEPVNVNSVQTTDDQETTIKSLHQCLTVPRKKLKCSIGDCRSAQEWDERFESCTEKLPKSERKIGQSYAIYLSSVNGAVLNAYYLDYNLIIVQEFLISFWNQTSLGNVLGAQDMWMPKGDTKRIVLGSGCSHKESSETVMVLDTSLAYVELWTKEHKSDKRERPVADIFVTIYLRLNATGPDKKVLQLENIHGYANDVQYIVLKNSPYIVVSWNTITDQFTSTVVHKYQLSSDYQTITNIVELHPATHYIMSLHNIEDSDTLIMGCGEDKITLWHVDDGYIVATLDLMAIAQQPRTLWAKADRGFIFTLHNFNDGYFHLIATNSFDYSWKQLQVYKQEAEFENLLGICIDSGLVTAFYDTGIICWSAESGEVIIESPYENSIFLPFGKHIVVIIENQVHVRNVLEYLVTIDDS